jgi:hypothetical protein
MRILSIPECYRKVVRHYISVVADPEDQNIPWNHDGSLGENDQNNLENIIIAWLQLLPGFNSRAIITTSSIPWLAERLRWMYANILGTI